MKVASVLACSLIACVAGFGCGGGGGGSGSTNSQAASHNAQILGQAQANSSSRASIHDALKEAVGLYHYSGLDDVFATPDGGHCSIDNIYTAPSDVKANQKDKNVVLSPDGKAGVLVVAFQGSDQALCLKTVLDGLHWQGGTPAPTPSGALTANELDARLNQICTQTIPTVEAAYKNLKTADQLATADSSTQPIRSLRLEQFRALQPPPELASTYAKFVKSWEEFDRLTAQERDAAAQVAGSYKLNPDYSQLHAIQGQMQAPNHNANKFAKQLGAQGCVG